MKEYIVRYETEQIENSEFFYGGKVECELIRCKDCKYYREPNEMMRSHYCWLLCEDVDGKKDYCSRAERKEE